MENHILQKGPVIILLALFCTILWGTAYPAVKIGYELFAIDAADGFGKLLFAGLRFTIAGLMTLAVSVAMQKKLAVPERCCWSGIALLGLVQTTCQYIFFYLGLANTSGVKGSILYALATFFVVIFAHLLFPDDRMTLQKIIGCCIGFTGVILITFDGTGLGGGFVFTGEGFIMLSTLSSALGSIISRRVTQGQDPVVITGYQLTGGGLVLILIGLLGHGQFGAVTAGGVLLLLYMAFLSAAAFTVWTMLLKYNPASKIAIYNFLIPIFGTTFSVMFLGESVFNVRSLMALLLACAGIYIVNKEFVRKDTIQPIVVIEKADGEIRDRTG
ncbi:MAG: DMT family transporter [Peptococcaceae bacterium]|nr:DMT family transporter [Peptococcaceae bacterium]